MSLFGLKDRVALVTGGNGGIGLGMALGLAEAGADIVIAARNAEKSKAAEAQLAAKGVRVAVVEVNVADDASVKEMISQTVQRMGRLDILVNNAGINIRKPPHTYAMSEWREVLSINLDGAFYCSHAAYEPMKKAGGGKIINIGSMMSIFGAPFAAPYAASKGGIVQMTKALATAWAKDNIQVNAVLPGWIDTELTQNARKQVDGLHENVLKRTPAGRWGAPPDFAGVAVFLASHASDFVTGTAIPVDGGFSVSG
ncbi:MAG: SDR family NAD(P)-dependent oxidoreductase [Hyphomicrobiaceae bacterium]